MEQNVSFNDCTLEYLEATFGVEQSFDFRVLNDWMEEEIKLSTQEKEELKSYQELLQFNVLHWNEQELSLHFIGPIFSLVKFLSRKYNLFAQRSLSATINGIRLYGKPDGLIASGYRSPQKPYFAFQVPIAIADKKERDPNGDPAAQALAAMLAGQVLNDFQHPIYGSYVIGRDWYFMALQGTTYAISRDYSAVTDDIYSIFQRLKALKSKIEAMVEI